MLQTICSRKTSAKASTVGGQHKEEEEEVPTHSYSYSLELNYSTSKFWRLFLFSFAGEHRPMRWADAAERAEPHSEINHAGSALALHLAPKPASRTYIHGSQGRWHLPILTPKMSLCHPAWSMSLAARSQITRCGESSSESVLANVQKSKSTAGSRFSVWQQALGKHSCRVTSSNPPPVSKLLLLNSVLLVTLGPTQPYAQHNQRGACRRKGW